MDRNTKTKISATLIAAIFTATNTMAASNITGINPQNGVYKISPEAILNGKDIGYRKYDNFKLDKGDIANLNYRYGNKNVETFVNLVDNKININGIVNSVRNNNFYSGKAVFISPKGMVVGTSGVINVGSLSISTPSRTDYNNLKSNPELVSNLSQLTNKSGDVTINGRIITTGSAEINSGTVKVSDSGRILSSTGNSRKIDSREQAERIFSKLVNTTNQSNGDILITTTNGATVSGRLQNNGKGDIVIINSGRSGIKIDGETYNTNGNTQIINRNGGINISGEITNRNGIIDITNSGNSNLDISGNIKTRGQHDINITNDGSGKLDIDGNITSGRDINIENTSNKGILIDTNANLKSQSDINIINSGKRGIYVKGIVNADNDVNIINEKSDVIIGDKSKNNNYITAGNDINIYVEDGSILNFGVDKTLLKSNGNLNMEVTNGSIGENPTTVSTRRYSNSNAWAKRGSWTYSKTINADVKGNLNAKATNTKETKTARNNQINSINYTAVNSDMNIDKIKADGNVLLIVDNIGEETQRYDMINSSSTGAGANIEANGITLISNGSIGDSDNKITFNQTGGKMDILANEDIYLKAESNEMNKTNEVNNLISREGNIDVEFGGNTHISNTTAEGDLKIITRGKELTIDNLGHLNNTKDYFGERNKGEADGGYLENEYKNETLPDNVTLKALDVNPYTRDENKTYTLIYGKDANSTVKVKNAVLDGGSMDITADEVYANGVHISFGENGYLKEEDNSTNAVIGADGNLTAHAVRPEDVEDVGLNTKSRKYYYHKENDEIIDETSLKLDGDTDVDNDLDTDTDIDNDIDTDIDIDTDNDTDTDTDSVVDDTIDNTLDTDTDIDNDIDTDLDLDTDLDTDTDNDATSSIIDNITLDNDTDNDIDIDTDIDTDLDIDIDIDIDTDTDNDSEKTYSIRKQSEELISYTSQDAINNLTNTSDKRQYMRYQSKELKKPVSIDKTNGITGIKDISRGGIGLTHTNTINVGDIVPVHIKYKDLDINAQVKILSATNNKAGGEFINLNNNLINQLLYLSIMLEADNDLLVTSIKG